MMSAIIFLPLLILLTLPVYLFAATNVLRKIEFSRQLGEIEIEIDRELGALYSMG